MLELTVRGSSIKNGTKVSTSDIVKYGEAYVQRQRYGALQPRRGNEVNDLIPHQLSRLMILQQPSSIKAAPARAASFK